MERTVPTTASDEIELYLRTIYSLLRSTAEVQIRSVEEVHAATNSALHLGARRSSPDLSAFIYSLLRLPAVIYDVRSVILGQTHGVFAQHGYTDVETWELVSARARRRRWLFNGKDTLACFIASRSDIDDVVPTLTAYQIEWNKLHLLMQRGAKSLLTPQVLVDRDRFSELAEALEMYPGDLDRLRVIWGDEFLVMLEKISQRVMSFGVRLLGGSLSEYWRATRAWWDNIELHHPELLERPIYFVSSNSHSIANLLSGFATLHKQELIDYVRREGGELLEEFRMIEANQVSASLENYLYYVMKKFQQTRAGGYFYQEQLEHEQALGIYRIPSEHSFDVEAQVIDLSRLDPAQLDSRLGGENARFLADSQALILNIDYPLGLAAYNLLAKVAEHAGSILGVYVMGKAATLNGVRGDVMIPDVVHDEHSLNTYLFRNAFTAADVAPYLLYGTVLDNQKAVSVMGTFLQNPNYMDVFYREGFTDIEMESGPYLSAIYELNRPQRHPKNEIVRLYNIPMDFGVLHYASDTPLSKGQNLGAGTLSYYGMDSTYACSLAILRRILTNERERSQVQNKTAEPQRAQRREDFT
ncbi:MAG TPA: hypothetical protein VFF68_07045 [Anaerolineaceae bacterium]|nr:hypothetical protein [Anaerolineaceae bacterium]